MNVWLLIKEFKERFNQAHLILNALSKAGIAEETEGKGPAGSCLSFHHGLLFFLAIWRFWFFFWFLWFLVCFLFSFDLWQMLCKEDQLNSSLVSLSRRVEDFGESGEKNRQAEVFSLHWSKWCHPIKKYFFFLSYISIYSYPLLSGIYKSFTYIEWAPER